MKRRELALGLAILGTVSAACLDGMRRVGRAIEERVRRGDAAKYRKEEDKTP